LFSQGGHPRLNQRNSHMDVPTVLILFGTDEYAIDQKIHDLISAMGASTTAEMNIARLDGHNLNMDAFNTAAKAIPFLSDHRLVILTNPYSIFKASREQQKFSTLIGSLPPTTNLVLVEVLDQPAGKNKGFSDWVQKMVNVNGEKITVQTREFNRPGRRDLPGWIIQETRKQSGLENKKIGIDPAAANRLAEFVGEDTRLAAQEIGKLLEHVNYERDVKVGDVEQVSIVSAHQDVFALVDALGFKDGHKAQHVLHQLLEKEDPFPLWGMVIRQFRLLLLTSEIISVGGKQDEISKEIHVHPYVAGKLVEQAKRFDLPGLEAIHHKLLELDEQMKTGQVTTALGLEMLVVELCG
jgi:DNA polymerase-3 subunit delta